MLCCVFLSTLAVCALLGAGRCCDPDSMCEARAPGDIIIGVLKPCHAKVEDLHKRIKPERFNCSHFNLRSFVRSLAVIHTIETINNSSFLPGIRLGYVICDTCSDATKALQNVQKMLAFNATVPLQCDLTERPLVKAIIGARYSEVSIVVARLLSLYMVPLISTTSSSATLDDKHRFPSFLRTIPSDVQQTRALAQLMVHYGWDWVGVVSGDDDYGKTALQSFLKDAEEAHVCTAFQKVLPHYLDHSDIDLRIREVVDEIKSSKAQVILLILKADLVQRLFKEMIKEGISRTWIASDAWSKTKPLATMKGINMVGDIFGFTFITGQNPGLKQYLQNLAPGPGVVNRFIEEYKDLRFGCSPQVQKQKDCLANKPAAECPLPDSLKFKSPLACQIPNPQEANDDFLSHAVDLTLAYGEKLAVWTLAHALKSLLNCSTSFCPGDRNILPWKLLQVLKDINFTLDGRNFFFNESGSFMNGYDLVQWVRDGNKRSFRVVGGFSPMKNTVDIKERDIEWGTPNKTIPESKCSKVCPPGTAKKILTVFCCHNCIICEEGTYSNVTNQERCHACPQGTWSLKGWTHCEQRTEAYFRWEDPFGLALLVTTGIGFVLLISVLFILVVGRKTVVFKVAGGKLCFIMIAGLAVSFGAAVLFVGRPNDHVCRARQAMYSLGFTLSVSCILIKAFRTFLAFLSDRIQQHRLNKLYKPRVIIVCGTGIQGLICIFWMIFDSPKVETHTSDQSMEIQLQCSEGSNWGFGSMLSYIALLAFICFILALKGRKVPHRFNETGYIIFSMLIYLFVWICFTPIYVTKIQQRSLIQASAIVVSNFGIIFCHFVPKCYMILFKKKTDISKESYLKQVRIFYIPPPDSEWKDRSIDSGAGSMVTIDSSEMETNSVESSTVATIRKLDELRNKDSSRHIRKRPRTKSI